jgi:diguanylate cyclase
MQDRSDHVHDWGGALEIDLNDELDLEYATAIADRAIRSMAAHSVPSTPHNFSVWFHYALGTPLELRQAIDVLISSRRKFDAPINRELYATFVDPRSRLQETCECSDRLDRLIGTTKQLLATAITDERTQIEALNGASSEIHDGGDPARIIEVLAQKLATATDRAIALEERFIETSDELGQLRETLQTAERLSKTDALTGLANRHSLEGQFQSTIILAMETGQSLSVLMLDIDHFKRFNDTYGHQTGDQALRLVAKILRESVRDVDLAARYGGEELIALLRGANIETCKAVAERIRCRIAAARLTRRSTGEEISSITVSIGVAQHRPGESSEALIERSDRALYVAKRLGRNRTVCESDLDKVCAASI